MSIEEKITELNKNILNLISAIEKINIQPNKDDKKFIPLSKWNSFHEYPSVSSLRFHVFNAKQNGANVWIKRIGKKIMIDKEFFNWINNK